MPDLDVSFMVNDPMLSDVFDVKRRSQTISDKGRAVNAVDKVFTDTIGVVTQDEPSDRDRRPDGTIQTRRITVCTEFQLLGAVRGRPGDIVTWNGTDYQVTSVQPYSRFGAGTYEAKAESATQPDEAQ